nr:hypothetical protein [Tanacetum cinerariifolium]
VKDKQEKDKTGQKREAWRSLAVSKTSHSGESRKKEENTKFKGPILTNPGSCI